MSAGRPGARCAARARFPPPSPGALLLPPRRLVVVLATGSGAWGERGRRASAEFTSQDQDPEVQTNAPGFRRSGSAAVTSRQEGQALERRRAVSQGIRRPAILFA